jgi:hypothetical protein
MERIKRDELEHDELPADADIRERLTAVMSGISEDAYCAGWNANLEYDLWAILTERIDPQLGFKTLDEYDLARLRDLHLKACGWVVWRRDDKPEDSGNYFVTTEEWEPIFEKWATKMAGMGFPLRRLTPEERAQVEAEQEAHLTGRKNLFDFSGGDEAVRQLRIEKGWKPVKPFYGP